MNTNTNQESNTLEYAAEEGDGARLVDGGEAKSQRTQQLNIRAMTSRWSCANQPSGSGSKSRYNDRVVGEGARLCKSTMHQHARKLELLLINNEMRQTSKVYVLGRNHQSRATHIEARSIRLEALLGGRYSCLEQA